MPRVDPLLIASARDGRILRVRAGDGSHRFTGIWMVVVEGRIFVRSWTLKPEGWFQTLLRERRGVIQVGGREVPVRAVRTRSERLKREVDRAYAGKYRTPASAKYVRGFRVPRRRDTTTELIPT
jgi:hypothetical protein